MIARYKMDIYTGSGYIYFKHDNFKNLIQNWPLLYNKECLDCCFDFLCDNEDDPREFCYVCQKKRVRRINTTTHIQHKHTNQPHLSPPLCLFCI